MPDEEQCERASGRDMCEREAGGRHDTRGRPAWMTLDDPTALDWRPRATTRSQEGAQRVASRSTGDRSSANHHQLFSLPVAGHHQLSGTAAAAMQPRDDEQANRDRARRAGSGAFDRLFRAIRRRARRPPPAQGRVRPAPGPRPRFDSRPEARRAPRDRRALRAAGGRRRPLTVNPDAGECSPAPS